MVRVKICGITNKEDAFIACDAGADALGFVFFKGSPRYITPEEARGIVSSLPPFITSVGVFVDEGIDRVKEIVDFVSFDILQFHGNESPEFCHSLMDSLHKKVIKAFRIEGSRVQGFKGLGEAVRQGLGLALLPQYHVSAYLLDTYKEDMAGGTGMIFDWDVAVEAKRYGRIILSGGLNPDNIKEAVERVRPYAVDVSSGVEVRPGKKDLKKVKEFIERAKG